MSLVTGSYAIRSAAFNSSYIGEGLGLRAPIPMPTPRPIISLPLDSEPTAVGQRSYWLKPSLIVCRHSQWNIEYLGAGRYFFKTESASTTVIDDLVYGVTLPRHLREEWHLIRLPQYDNQFLYV